MSPRSQFPELPLMLAGLSGPLAELLHEVGLPVAPLPTVPLLASGIGRFVLFDSRERHSSEYARRAAPHGLELLDLRELAPWISAGEPRPAGDAPFAPRTALPGACAFLERLKARLEARGGSWVRVADYPFPYQSAISLAVEHVPEDSSGFGEIAATVTGMATHFVSSRLRADRLKALTEAGQVEVGWRVTPEDFERTSRSTLSHWKTRTSRFAAAGVVPVGLALEEKAGALPSTTRLAALGFDFSCVPGNSCSCTTGPQGRDREPGSWALFRTIPAPPRQQFLESIGEHYQSGCPLFVSVASQGAKTAEELRRISADAARCSLLWRTSLGEFARWWRARQKLQLTVWRTDTGHEIQAAGDFGSQAWAVEIWRGGHVATLPLQQSELFVPDEGLVYLQSLKRNPAGCAVPGRGNGNPSAPEQEGRPHVQVRFNRPRFPRKGSPE